MAENLITHSHYIYSTRLPPPLTTSGGFAWGWIKFDSYRPWKLCGERGKFAGNRWFKRKATECCPGELDTIPASDTEVWETSTVKSLTTSEKLASLTHLWAVFCVCVWILAVLGSLFPSVRSVVAALWRSLTPGWRQLNQRWLPLNWVFGRCCCNDGWGVFETSLWRSLSLKNGVE